VIEHLSSKRETLSSILSTEEKKEKKGDIEEEEEEAQQQQLRMVKTECRTRKLYVAKRKS
jgi:hypothetical protein